ncbi:hypothetical protein ACOTWN_05065 [Aliarcobacter butzleri]
MSEYIVRTKEIELIIKPEEESYFEKSKLEAYEYGTYIQCNDFIKKIPIEIQSYFTIEEIEEYV